MNKKNKIILLIIAVLLVLGYFGYRKLFASKNPALEAQTQEYEIKLMDINQTYSTSGNVSSKADEVIRASFVSEKFELAIEVGDEVKKGDLIGIFDDSDIRISLLTQEKTVISIQYQLDQLKNEGNKSYVSSYESSKLAYENAKSTYEINLDIYTTGAISLSELEASKDTMDNAFNVYDLNRGRYYGFDLENEIEILEKTLEVETIRLEKLILDFEKVQLLAETDGTIVDIFVDSGESINIGQNLYQIMDLENLEIITQISEYEIKDVEEGQEVIVTVLGNDSVISGNEVTVTVHIDLINPSPELLPGFSTNLEIMIASKKNAKVVPYDALISSPKGYMITKLVDGEEIMISVDTGIESDLMIEIISDEIKEGDIVKVMSTIDFSNDNKGDKMMFPGKNKLDNEKP